MKSLACQGILLNKLVKGLATIQFFLPIPYQPSCISLLAHLIPAFIYQPSISYFIYQPPYISHLAHLISAFISQPSCPSHISLLYQPWYISLLAHVISAFTVYNDPPGSIRPCPPPGDYDYSISRPFKRNPVPLVPYRQAM